MINRILVVAAALSTLSALAAPQPRLVAECTGPVNFSIYVRGANDFYADAGPVRFTELKNFTIPGEEVHFEAPGFRLEVITNLSDWTPGVDPGDYGLVWIGDGKGEAQSVHCSFR